MKKLKKAWRRFIWRQFTKAFKDRVRCVQASIEYDEAEFAREGGMYFQSLVENSLRESLAEGVLTRGGDYVKIEDEVDAERMKRIFKARVYLLKM